MLTTLYFHFYSLSLHNICRATRLPSQQALVCSTSVLLALCTSLCATCLLRNVSGTLCSSAGSSAPRGWKSNSRTGQLHWRDNSSLVVHLHLWTVLWQRRASHWEEEGRQRMAQVGDDSSKKSRKASAFQKNTA
jgi:hypothetical protein